MSEEENDKFIEHVLTLLNPLDDALNKIILSKNVRTIYFALADSRERLIQFLGKKKVNELVPVLLQMNLWLNKLTRVEQNKNLGFKDIKTIIPQVLKWRKIVRSVIIDLSH
ncbi:MAG: hypothetical protein EU551_02450 [Promethearchaeota archaeon]|nr:MAG: hypothetical protein EU551_02450 [Candidatus Lokiarchaeota archaeon]